MYVNSCCPQELSSGGFFNEAANSLAELVSRLKLKFPTECKREDTKLQLAKLYVRAKDIAEAGANNRKAAEYASRAAVLYADAALWKLAEEWFEVAGTLQREDIAPEPSLESFNNAVLCRIGQVDLVGAEQLMLKHVRTNAASNRPSDLDALLKSVFKAYDKWSPQILETACKKYSAVHALAPWQVSKYRRILYGFMLLLTLSWLLNPNSTNALRI